MCVGGGGSCLNVFVCPDLYLVYVTIKKPSAQAVDWLKLCTLDLKLHSHRREMGSEIIVQTLVTLALVKTYFLVFLALTAFIHRMPCAYG